MLAFISVLLVAVTETTPPDWSITAPAALRTPQTSQDWLKSGSALALLIATDRRTLQWLDPDAMEPDENGETDTTAKSLNTLGRGDVLAASMGALYLFGGSQGRQASVEALNAALTASVWVSGLKFLVGRDRPYQTNGNTKFHGPSLSHASFPSGHTAAAFAVAKTLSRTHAKYKWLWYGLAASVGWARVNSARHFLSDVVVGAQIGLYAAEHSLNLLSGSFRF